MEKIGDQKAYKLLSELVSRAYSVNRPLQDILEENPHITGQLSPQELSEVLKPQNHIGMAPKIAELAVIAAEEWLSANPAGDLSEYFCPLADKNGDCTIFFKT